MCQYMIMRICVVTQGLEDSHSLVNLWLWGQGPDTTVRGPLSRNQIHIIIENIYIEMCVSVCVSGYRVEDDHLAL